MSPIRCLVAISLIAAAASAQPAQVKAKRVEPVARTEQQQFQTQDKVAILAGVGHYPKLSGLTQLLFPAADVQALGAELKRQGYHVSILEDGEATKGSIVAALQNAHDMVQKDTGTILFFFSGHGFAEKGENYLATYEASSRDLANTGMPLTLAQDLLKRTGAARQIMFIDACRNEAGKSVATRTFENFRAAQGVKVMFATGFGKVSYEDPALQHGVFAYFLIKGLQGEAAAPDKFITFRDLLDYVTISVRDYGYERGPMQLPFEAGESSGDFLLGQKLDGVPPAAPITPSPTPTVGSSQSDQAIFTAALASGDPDKMEEAANKVSNPAIASSLRNMAANRRMVNGTVGQLGGASSAGSAQSDQALYMAAIQSRDPDKMEAAANKVSNPNTASTLRGMAASQRLINSRYGAAGGAPGPVTPGSTPAGVIPTISPMYSPELMAKSREARNESNAIRARTSAKTYYNRGNYTKALPLFQEAAELGDEESMIWAAGMYATGLGADKNAKEAAKWYQKAADEGEPKAMIGLAGLYAAGKDGIAKDDAKAFEWNRKAALANNPEAMNLVGYAYEHGNGAPVDLNQATIWYRKSADLGNQTARHNLQIVESQRINQETTAADIRTALTIPVKPGAINLVDLNILFDTNASTLTREGSAQVHQLALALGAEELKGKTILITGHTDSGGTPEYNQKLSLRRAEAVRDALLQEKGAAGSEIQCEGKGQSNPKYLGDTPAIRQLNRRVEVSVKN